EEMKKKFLAVLLAGIMVGALAACGGTAEVTEEPPIPVEEEIEEEEPVEDEDVIEDEEEEIVSPDHVFDIPESVWIYGKSHDTWFVTEGLFWYAVDLDGETVDEGTLYAESENSFDVYDPDGELLTTFTITDEGDLFDETYQELYYQVGHLPARFPNELAEEIGFNDIAGEWVYQEQNIDNPELYDDIAFIRIYQDGTYEIRFYGDDSFRDGVILIELEEYPGEDSYTPIYSFFEGGNNYWAGCYTGEREEDIIYFGNGGSERLVPAEGQG
ncbi:MAG: hypothetical protein J6W48_08130, partial [Lachnospiraceae bacterium]|nr:hypothetical protein [Lachnospiraceae bacterium]